ncbi:hypothetical protein CBR_g54324 [Chara braunii]|uniref:DUF659 domain-containing protein n=1 Tax=Chara braunii TaxID=69332 RepID=A0A388MC81_CHABU|nr:hypothetical protein CBR_g54324 [Chara braunii]|eukprot:GBG92069.1 hypothetical protein CBR_g54324 [Chara braunii]
MLGTSAQGSIAGQKSGNLTQTSIKRWATNDSQQRLNVAWGMHLFRHGAPFNYVRTKETQELNDLYLELGEKRQRVKMPSLEVIRTVLLDIIYKKVLEDMHPLKAKWDNTGCNLLTDGCTDRRYRPVMNFIGAGESGAILLKVVDVSKKKKTAIALAMMWEQMIRDIGVHRVNVICTDNAEVNKQAARILRRRTDRDISSILWISCATHFLNLLMKDVCELDWVKEVVQRMKMMLLNIKKKKSTGSLAGYLDMWAAFFNDVEAPTPNDPVASPRVVTPADLSDDKVAGRTNLAKTPRARVLWPHVVDGSSSSDNSDDGEDLIWRGKGNNKKVFEVVDGGKGKLQMDVDDEEQDTEESEEDYENFPLRSPRASDISSDDNELDDDLTRNVERVYLDSDLEFLRPRGMNLNACVEVDKDFDDDADRARAQSLAHRDHALVEQRIREETAKRSVAPLRGG